MIFNSFLHVGFSFRVALLGWSIPFIYSLEFQIQAKAFMGGIVLDFIHYKVPNGITSLSGPCGLCIKCFIDVYIVSSVLLIVKRFIYT